MDEASDKLRFTPQIVLTCTNLVALVVFVFSPLAHLYPMAMSGIIAFTLVQLLVPACWINLESPVCPGNFAQFFFWVQIVLVPVLIGYYGPSLGTLPHLPPEHLINFSIGLRVLGYVAFCVSFQLFSKPIHFSEENREAINVKAISREKLAIMAAFAGIGAIGWLFFYGGIGGFIAYASSPDEQRMRDEEAATIAGALGNLMRHFLGFSIVWTWSEWVQRRSRTENFKLVAIATAAVAGMLMLANFSYNRGNMVAPLLALTAAYSKHVRHISFAVAAAAGSVLLVVAFVFGHYRSTSMQLSELSINEVASFGDKQGAVDEIQIYGAGPQLTAFILEGVEADSNTQRSSTIISSILYPIPVIGKPFRETSGVIRFNHLLYGDADNFDQNIPYDAEFYINFQAVGVILGYLLLGFLQALCRINFFLLDSRSRAMLGSPLGFGSYFQLAFLCWLRFASILFGPFTHMRFIRRISRLKQKRAVDCNENLPGGWHLRSRCNDAFEACCDARDRLAGWLSKSRCRCAGDRTREVRSLR